MKLYADPVRCVQCGFDKIDGWYSIRSKTTERNIASPKNFASWVGGGTRIYEVIKRKGRIEGLQVLCALLKNTIKQLRHGKTSR